MAFNAGPLLPVAGLDGIGSGTMSVTENGGRTCSRIGFAWALYQ